MANKISIATLELEQAWQRQPEPRYDGPTCRAASTWGHCPRPRPDDADFCEYHYQTMEKTR